VAHQLVVTILLVPDSDSPIIGASQEDGAVIRMPEWVAPDTVDGAHVAVVVVGVALRERGGALVHGTVLSGDEVVVASIIHGEVNGKATGVDECHTARFLLIDSAGINIFLVGIRLTLELLQVAVL